MATDDILSQAEALLPLAVELRRTLHRHPEVGLPLPRTRQTVLEALEGLPLRVDLHRTTGGVVAVLEGASDGPTVLLRGDMDALPMPEDTGLAFASETGAMHACGHDLHTAMLVGAIHLLAGRRGELSGRVMFMFQPGEEGEHGARWMLDEGMLESVTPGPTRAFAIHVLTTLPSGVVGMRAGPLLAAADEIVVTVTGRGGHASMPHLAADPIPVACEIVTAIQIALTRSIPVFDPGVITFGHLSAGSAHNVIPEAAVLNGTIRSLSETTRQALHALVRRVADGVAAAHGLSADVELRFGYPATINDPGVIESTHQLATDLFGADRVRLLADPLMGAEDWSYVLQRVPGMMALLGACPAHLDPATAPYNHSNRVDFDERAMVAGMALYAGFALAG
jgi:hippurate hydrolase